MGGPAPGLLISMFNPPFLIYMYAVKDSATDISDTQNDQHSGLGVCDALILR